MIREESRDESTAWRHLFTLHGNNDDKSETIDIVKQELRQVHMGMVRETGEEGVPVPLGADVNTNYRVAGPVAVCGNAKEKTTAMSDFTNGFVLN